MRKFSVDEFQPESSSLYFQKMTNDVVSLFREVTWCSREYLFPSV
jgi:hypothetical protein